MPMIIHCLIIFKGVHELASLGCCIFVKSKRSAERVLRNTTRYIEDKLHLQVNKEKTNICRPITFHMLGYNFVSSYKQGVKGKYQLRVSPERFKRMKQKVKEITRKKRPLSFSDRITELNSFMKGWIGYFRHAKMQGKLQELDVWIRNRLRYRIWN